MQITSVVAVLKKINFDIESVLICRSQQTNFNERHEALSIKKYLST